LGFVTQLRQRLVSSLETLDNHKIGLTPFEWSMLDQVSLAPMIISIRLMVSGKVDTERFEASILNSVQQEPLLQSYVEVGETHLDSYWVPAEDLKPRIDWVQVTNDEETSASAIVDDPIDLTREIGIRFEGKLNSNNDSAEFNFLIHHACSDGLGAFGFIDRVLCRYHAGSDSQRNLKLAEPDARVLASRNPDAKKRLATWKRILRSTVILPKRIIGASLKKPVSLSSKPPVSETRQMYRSLSVSLNRETKNRLAKCAEAVNVSLHVLLIRELTKSIERWKSTPELTGDETIRLLVPFSLRTDDHAQMPAANCVSMTFVAVTGKQVRQSADKLAKEISDQMKFIRKWQIEYSWSQTIALFASSRFLRPRLRKLASKQLATTVFSNLGRVFRDSSLPKTDHKIQSGEMVVESAHIAAPCDRFSPATFAANFYGDQLTLDMNYAPHHITAERAGEILSIWKANLIDCASADKYSKQ
jgi:NRPS condensation-like uncharacterized protein